MLQMGDVVSSMYYNNANSTLIISNNNAGIQFNTSGLSNAFNLSSTGAATFSSSVTAGGLLSVSYANARASINSTTTTNSAYMSFGNTVTGYVGLDNSLGSDFGNGAYSLNLINGGAYNLNLGTSNTTRMTITSGGNVGIGTSSPVAKLNIVNNGINSYCSTVWDNSNSNASLAIGVGGNTVGVSYLQNNAYILNNGTSDLIFGTNGGTERMRITSGGAFKASNTGGYLNASSSYHELRQGVTDTNTVIFTNISASPYGNNIWFTAASPNNTTNYFLTGGDNTNDKFFIWSNGSIVNRTGSYGTISDIKYKENIVDATPKLADLMQLKVRNFNLIGEETKQIGFIAQEFEEVFPKMIDISTNKESGEEYKSIKTSVLIPMLVKAIQEQQAQIELLSNKIVALESK
jgi:hypothetical protein